MRQFSGKFNYNLQPAGILTGALPRTLVNEFVANSGTVYPGPFTYTATQLLWW